MVSTRHRHTVAVSLFYNLLFSLFYKAASINFWLPLEGGRTRSGSDPQPWPVVIGSMLANNSLLYSYDR